MWRDPVPEKSLPKYNKWENMHLLYAGTAAFYIKNMSVLGFEYLWGSWNHIAPQILREKQLVSTREKMGAT